MIENIKIAQVGYSGKKAEQELGVNCKPALESFRAYSETWHFCNEIKRQKEQLWFWFGTVAAYVLDCRSGNQNLPPISRFQDLVENLDMPLSAKLPDFANIELINPKTFEKSKLLRE